EGTVVRVQGHIDYYQNRFSPGISYVDKLPSEELPRYLPRLIETAPYPLEDLWREFEGYMGDIGHEGLRLTVQEALADMKTSFKTTPGAISMHHAYRGGLMEHTVRMARAAN